jgi:phosphoenolpyruvate-protein phosphotransferase (PTS system enzyme I)
MAATSAPDDYEGPREELRLSASGVSPGIAIAPAFVFAAPELLDEPRPVSESEIPVETKRFEQARHQSVRELRKIATFAREKLGEASAEIFEAQILALTDTAMDEAVTKMIASERIGADHAIRLALGSIRRRMESSGSDYLRERAGDISDVQNRLLRNLQQTRAVSRIAPGHIVVAESLTAADLLLFSRRKILGVATDFGGPTSHVSIMARSLGVPAVVSLHGLSEHVKGGEMLIVDGFSGRVVVNPTEETLRYFEDRRDRYRARVEQMRGERLLPAETRCGVHITVRGNIELDEELPLLAENGSEGIGLFRTEMLLLARGKPLDEEEQFEVFSKVVRAASPHPTVFRLLDLGGDKMLPMAHREHNPFLGWRGVRVLLDKPEILRPQMRAIARVAVQGPVRMLIPMVSSLEEVHRIKDLFRLAVASLKEDGVEHREDVPLGIMVEVPSVALAAEHYASEVDFMSIGSNDLTQFVLAVDRGNDLVFGRYREVHPVVLRLIRDTVVAGAKRNIPVSLCGEMAGNPRVAPLLIGLGLRELSASPTFLPDLKVAIRSTTLADARQLARQALAQVDAQSVQTLTTQWMSEHVPELAMYFDQEDDREEETRRAEIVATRS